MRSKLIVFVLTVASAAVTAQAQNQISNWEFDQQVDPLAAGNGWYRWEEGNFAALSIVENAGMSGRYAMKVDIGGGSLDPLQFFHSFLKLERGKKYYISFMAKAVAPRPMTVGLEARSLYNWVIYWSADVQLTTEAQLFTLEYTHTGETVGGTGVFNNDIDLQFWLTGNGTDLYLDRVWLATEPPPAPDKTTVARPFKPVPVSGSQDVPADTSLSWVPGVYAATHNVYLGQSLADVNNAAVGSALLVSPGQAGTTYQSAAPLEYGKTYYWRVDEVNAAPSTTVFKGEIWSFTVEPYAYPLTSVTATASSVNAATSGPGNTVNDTVGLVNDLHGIDTATMWLSNKNDPNAAWIQYQFDKAYKLYELWIWNYNAALEKTLGYGFKDVTITYSADGTTWTPLIDVQFARGPATTNYAHNTTVNLQGILARYVRLTAKNNWGGKFKQYGLSEVRFYYLPVQARAPQPDDFAALVGLDATLNWRQGRDAVSENVYFSTDRAAVIAGTAPAQAVTNHSFTPAALGFGTSYYWKVDEIGATTYPGDVWKFTTFEYQTVDDFESYTDQENYAVFQTWIDGTMNNGTGSTVGLLNPVNGTYCATDVFHGGSQSMPFGYDNTQSPYYSEAIRTFDNPQDWAAHDANSLILYFRGFPADAAADQQKNVPDSLYVTVEDKSTKKKTVVNSDPTAVNRTDWTSWQIDYSQLTGVNLSQVKKLTIGVGNPAGPKAGATGLLYIDDIRFGKPAAPGATNRLTNGGFETGDTPPWGIWGGGGATVTYDVATTCVGAAVPEGPAEGTRCLHIVVSGPSTNFWDCQFQTAAITFQKGKKYTLSAFFKSKSGTARVNMKPQYEAAPYPGYGETQVLITDQWAEYHLTTPVFTTDLSPTTLTFHIGFQAQEFWVDNIQFYEGDYVPSE